MNGYKRLLTDTRSRWFAMPGCSGNAKRTTMIENKHTNKVFLRGNLGKDPEVRELQGGNYMARMSMATNEKTSTSDGRTREDTQWHNLVAWGRTAKEMGDSLRKGNQVAVEGKLVHRTYDGKDGQRRYITEVVIERYVPVTSEQAA